MGAITASVLSQSQRFRDSKSTASNKDALVEEVKKSWTDTSDSVSDSYGSVRDWIFDRYEMSFEISTLANMDSAGLILNSRLSVIRMASPPLPPANATVSYRPHVKTIRLLPRNSTRRLSIPVTGYTRPGLSQSSRSSSTSVVFPFRSPRPGTH